MDNIQAWDERKYSMLKDNGGTQTLSSTKLCGFVLIMSRLYCLLAQEEGKVLSYPDLLAVIFYSKRN